VVAGLTTVLFVPALAQAQETAEKQSTVPPAIQEARRAMLDASINTLTFHSMDELFETREVSRSGPVWTLPRRDAELDFDYTVGDESLAASGFAGRTFTNALVILKHGSIVHERYRNLTDERERFVSFSMAKSITSMLIGIALEEGHIKSLDDPISDYVTELKGSGYEGVSIRNIMRMRSGVAYDERYDFNTVQSQAQKTHELAIVQNVERFTFLAPTLQRVATPGEAFNYSTMDTAVLGWMLERATRQPVSTYTTAKLWEPAGMEWSGFWMADGPPGVGRALSGMGYNAAARDYARLGQLMLQKGRVMGRQILPEDWIELSTASTATNSDKAISSQDFTLGYGYQWWTLHGTGAYIAIGLQGQYIYVDPLTETVVVKLSYYPPGDDSRLANEAFNFFRAVSSWNP
jgi:CubicO group peptidase (beta-lactamase class C family)